MSTKKLESMRLDSVYDEIFIHNFAPAIDAYVRWVLKQAVKNGHRRLYFLARDGWLMYRAACNIVAESTDQAEKALDLRYLEVSRFSIRSAQYHLMGAECLDLLCLDGIAVSFATIMQRSMLTPEEAKQIAALTGYQNCMDTKLNYHQLQKLKYSLKETGMFLECVYLHSRERYANAVGYLKQEGLLDDARYAVVDSGWTGTLQMSLQQLISAQKGCRERLEGYYFGLYELPKDADERQYHAFYIRPNRDISRKVRFSICLFETVCSAPEGMTLDYSYDGSCYQAIRDTGVNANVDYLRRNVRLLEQYQRWNEVRSDSIEACRNLKHLMSRPTLEEVKTLGELRFCDDVLETNIQALAAEWNIEELRQQRFINKVLVKLGVRKGTLHESAWPEGSITRVCTKELQNVRAALRQERCYKRFMYVRKAIEAKWDRRPTRKRNRIK